jgi:hypothetical protein
MGNLDENRNLNVNIEKKINGIQRTGISCVAGPWPCLNVFATRVCMRW